jgi:alkylation response protein AidB-like acyl-CoA dehydrogenase
MFNEVFLNDARVRDDAAIGGLNNGWAVANTTLMFERTGLGAGGGGAGGTALPGTIRGDLHLRAGDLVGARERVIGGGTGSSTERLAALAREHGRIDDPGIRQDLARLFTWNELGRTTNLRQRALAKQGREVPGLGNILKLGMSRIHRLTRDLTGAILGPEATLHPYNSDDEAVLEAATGHEGYSRFTEAMLFAQGPSIYGGTDEIQRNIIGERVLGLPREPGPEKDTPFRDLPKNG